MEMPVQIDSDEQLAWTRQFVLYEKARMNLTYFHFIARSVLALR